MRQEASPAIRLGNLVVDPERCDAWIDERSAGLTFIELELLIKLARRAGRVVSRDDLSVILSHDPASEHSVPLNTHMSRLRKKLQDSRPWVIRTVWKRGYMLQEEDAAQKTHVRRSA